MRKQGDSKAAPANLPFHGGRHRSSSARSTVRRDTGASSSCRRWNATSCAGPRQLGGIATARSSCHAVARYRARSRATCSARVAMLAWSGARRLASHRSRASRRARRSAATRVLSPAPRDTSKSWIAAAAKGGMRSFVMARCCSSARVRASSSARSLIGMPQKSPANEGTWGGTAWHAAVTVTFCFRQCRHGRRARGVPRRDRNGSRRSRLLRRGALPVQDLEGNSSVAFLPPTRGESATAPPPAIAASALLLAVVAPTLLLSIFSACRFVFRTRRSAASTLSVVSRCSQSSVRATGSVCSPAKDLGLPRTNVTR